MNTRIKQTLIACISVVVGLTGCNEREEALLASPQTIDVGTFDGCAVRFVNRGYASTSFYIARCDSNSTSTVTRNWRESVGKTTVDKRSTVVSHIDDHTRLVEVKQALDRLTESDKAMLGIK